MGDLSPRHLLWTVTHSNGMSLAKHPHEARQITYHHTSEEGVWGVPNNSLAPSLDTLMFIYDDKGFVMCVSDILPCLGEMLYGSVQVTSVMFNGSHIPVDTGHLLWLTTVFQQLQRLLTLE